MRSICLPSDKPFVSIRLTGVILRARGIPCCPSSYWGDFECAGGTQQWFVAVPLVLARDIDLLVCAAGTAVGTLVNLVLLAAWISRHHLL